MAKRDCPPAARHVHAKRKLMHVVFQVAVTGRVTGSREEARPRSARGPSTWPTTLLHSRACDVPHPPPTVTSESKRKHVRWISGKPPPQGRGSPALGAQRERWRKSQGLNFETEQVLFQKQHHPRYSLLYSFFIIRPMQITVLERGRTVPSKNKISA
jgi:hypothetical protein